MRHDGAPLEADTSPLIILNYTIASCHYTTIRIALYTHTPTVVLSDLRIG